MKKQIRKHPFNMVEVALAMAIIAIGLSGILVLFPVGINASKSAIADNNLADIVEYIMGYLQARCNEEWIKNANNPPTDPNALKNYNETYYPFSNALPSTAPSGTDSSVGDIEGVSLDSELGTNNKFDKTIHGISISTSNADEKRMVKQATLFIGPKGTFLYRQMTNETVDFAAIIKVWREKINCYVPKIIKDSETAPDLIDENIPQYAHNLVLEISWPAEVPYANREKKVFRLEFFNQAYQIPATP